MTVSTDAIETLRVDPANFDDAAARDSRVTAVVPADRGAVRTALRYLYDSDGPTNLPRDRMLAAAPHLDAAERVIVRWLFTRTNGSLRREYGPDALRAARRARFRCERCGFADVRALNLDHVAGRVARTAFACLCANCHAVKSRQHDWTGVARVAAGVVPADPEAMS